MADHSSVLAIEQRRGTVLCGIVERYTLRKMRVRRGDCAHPDQCRPYSMVRCHEHDSVLHLLRQGQELLTQGVRRLQFGT